MKRIMRSLLVLLLSIAMMMPNADILIAYALSEPFDRSELTVPEELQDGNSWYFIHESMYTVSEKSGDKLYIPIQRTGDLSREGDVSLKLVDVTSKHDVTYKEEIFRESPEEDVELADASIMELVNNAHSQEEIEPLSEEELAEAIAENGGADVVDAEGNPVGEITVQKTDENGNPVTEEVSEEETPAEEVSAEEETVIEEQPAEEAQSTEVGLENDPSAEDAEWEEGELTGTAALRKASNDFTGTVSDRQALENGDGIAALGEVPADDATELVDDSMPGKIYNLHFEAGEDAKYLVITPLYDEAADGDAQLMLMLKNPDDESMVADSYRVTAVNFKDEDEHQPVRIGMAEEMVIAENGKASITVTREGMKNSLVGIHLTSWGGNAVMGEDYSGVGADLYLPMGITSRTVELAVAEGEHAGGFGPKLDCLREHVVTFLYRFAK